MRRTARFLMWGLAGLASLGVMLVVIIALFDWNLLRPWVSARASDALQRPVEIRGDLDVDWQWQGGGLPWPHITARELVAGHPEGYVGQGEEMAQVDYLALSINPLPLFARRVEIPRLEIGDSRILLQRNMEGRNNWAYERRQQQEGRDDGWAVDLQSIALRHVELRVLDETRKLDMTTRFNSLDTDAEGGYGMDWESAGTFNDADVTGRGKVGGLLSLRERSDPFPLQGEVSFGETRIALEGSMTAPKGLASLDLRLTLAGSSMADLNALFGLALPTTAAYSTEGRLIAMLEGEGDTWRYEDFKGMVGESDLRGTLEYRMGGARPVLVGEVASNLLHFRDLGPLIGADTSESSQKEKTERRDGGPDSESRSQPPGKALPVARIGSETWDLMDADVRFKGRRIIQNENLPLDDIDAHVKLQDRVLSFEPLDFGVAGGTLSNTIRVDGKGETLHARMQTRARGLQLKQLFPGAESMNASFGQLHGDATLEGSGDSIASLLGTSNGELSLALSRGTISRFLIEAAGLNVANVIFVKLFGDEQVMLECLMADFSVKDGLMQTRSFTLETEDAVITMTGSISLKNETLDLDIRPQNKTLRIFTLRSPLYAKGSFKNPDVGVQAAPVAARAGAAVALGVVATPLAALIPLLNLGTDEEAGCTAVGGSKGAGQKAGERGGEARKNGSRSKGVSPMEGDDTNAIQADILP